MRATRLALLAGALCAALPARAVTPSPRQGTLEIGAGNYTPDIDAGAAPGPLGSGPPYQEMFGNGRGWMFRFALARTLYSGFGSVDVGVQSGFFRRNAKAFSDATPEAATPTWVRSGDTTSLNVIPTSLTLTYRFDWLVDRKPSIPLAPYVRASLERYNWWISGPHGTSKVGATNGYSVTGGLALALDFFDRDLGREMDTEFGVNHTYLYFDATKNWVDDFGSAKSWDMSGKELMLSGGLMFAF